MMPKEKNQLKRYIANARLLKKRYEKANLYGRYDLRIAQIRSDIEKATGRLKAI